MKDILKETKFLMKKYHLTANKRLGQNFLIDNIAIEKIVEASNISCEDIIIEIGPGLGTLTSYLLEKAGKVIAIELDDRMIGILKDRFTLYKNFELIQNDVLKVDLDSIIKENSNFKTVKNQVPNIVKELAINNIKIYSIIPKEQSLEEIFFDATKGGKQYE